MDLKRLHRVHGKSLIMQIESLLPATIKSSAKRNGAGSRSLGKRGRTLTDVLGDTVQYIRRLRGRLASEALSRDHANTQMLPTRAPLKFSEDYLLHASKISSGAGNNQMKQAYRSAEFRDLLAESEGILCIEVHMGGDEVSLHIRNKSRNQILIKVCKLLTASRGRRK